MDEHQKSVVAPREALLRAMLRGRTLDQVIDKAGKDIAASRKNNERVCFAERGEDGVTFVKLHDYDLTPK